MFLLLRPPPSRPDCTAAAVLMVGSRLVQELDSIDTF